MTKELTTKKEATEAVPITPKKKHLYNESHAMFQHGIQAGYIEKLLKCAALWNIHEHGLHWAEGVTWQDYLQKIGFSERSARRYLHIAELMKAMCGKTLKVAGDKTSEEDFIFNQRLIKDTFSKFFTNGEKIGIAQLANHSRSLSEFENFLSGNADLSEREVTKLLASPRSKDDELPPVKPSIGDDLFTIDEKMKSAGYIWDASQKRYTNKDGSPLSLEQIGEIIPEEFGFKIFETVTSPIEKAKEQIAQAVEIYGIYYKAYATMHPGSEKKSGEELSKLRVHFKELQALAFQLTPKED